MPNAQDTTTLGVSDAATRLRAPSGPVDLEMIDPDGTPGYDGDKKAGKAEAEAMGDEVLELQTKLAAHGYTGGDRSVLVAIQGMDTSGKGGVLKHAVGLLDPGGVRVTSFKAPTAEELRYDFLWRVEPHVPRPGQVAIFDRSHYEDVLVARVRGLADPAEVERRYGAINEFEQRLVDGGTTILKFMLHISFEEQRQRLLARLDEPTKRWKFKPEDVDERQRWDDYQRAYEIALDRCSTDAAPWYVVPSNRKWYRTLAIVTVLRDALRAMDLQWPEPDYDVAEQRRRLGG